MPSPTSLWMTAGQALNDYLGMIDGSHREVSSTGWVALSSIPVAETNMAYIRPSVADPAAMLLQVQRVAELARQHVVPLLLLIPEPQTSAVAPEIGALGLIHVGAIPLMIRSASPMTPLASTFTTRQVLNQHDLEFCHDLIAQAFHIPVAAVAAYIPAAVLTSIKGALFVTSSNGVPVSTVLAFRLGNAVGLRLMATYPDYQGRGAGRALLNYVIDHYAAEGAMSVYLGSTEAGMKLYRQAGFKVVEQTPVWLAPPVETGGAPCYCAGL